MIITLDHWCDIGLFIKLLEYDKATISSLLKMCNDRNEVIFAIDGTTFKFTKDHIIIYSGAEMTMSFDKMIMIFNGIMDIILIDAVKESIKNSDYFTFFITRPNNYNVKYHIDTIDTKFTNEYVEAPIQPQIAPSRTVVWETDDIGKITIQTGAGKTIKPCYSEHYGKSQMYTSVSCSIITSSKNMYHIMNGLDYDISWVYHLIKRNMDLIEPLAVYDSEELLSEIINTVKKYVTVCKEQNIKTNLAITALAGSIKDWKSQCCICLEEEHMSKLCDCGHSETIMFYPCQHTMCRKPCFEGYMKSIGHISDNGSMTKIINGIKFLVSGMVKTDMDTNFDCPLCRQKVSHVFCPELEALITEQDKEIILPPL